MKLINLILLLTVCSVLSMYLASRYYYYSPLYTKITHATAVIHPTKGNTAHGIVEFVQKKDGIHILAQIADISPGEHGFHIHEFGDCGCDDAVCAGGHFNPSNEPHAGPNSSQRHAGDMGNVVANENGMAKLEYVDKKMQLNGPHSIIGRAVIIHEKQDDLISQPTGDAGSRIGCGTIGIKK